jgi:hypothetical protein
MQLSRPFNSPHLNLGCGALSSTQMSFGNKMQSAGGKKLKYHRRDSTKGFSRYSGNALRCSWFPFVVNVRWRTQQFCALALALGQHRDGSAMKVDAHILR